MSDAPRTLSLCLLPGDGIGPEVLGAATSVLAALPAHLGITIATHEAPAGHGTWVETGEALPHASVDAARAADAVLVGAMDVAQLPSGVRQPLRTLRRELGVSVSLRASRSLPGVPCLHDDVDVMVVREVTEGLFGGVEHTAGADAACSVRVITRGASHRAAELAFAAAARRRGRVTAVHKVGALPTGDGLWLEAVGEVAARHPEVEYETRNVDACAMELVQHPADFDVVLCPNAFGDVLSDVAAGLVGGLGLAASACVGPDGAYFEPVHGTAPDIAGRGVANPLAAIRSASLLLRHVGETAAADIVEAAVLDLLAEGAPLTPDLGGTASTDEVTAAIRDRVAAATPGVTVG